MASQMVREKSGLKEITQSKPAGFNLLFGGLYVVLKISRVQAVSLSR